MHDNDILRCKGIRKCGTWGSGGKCPSAP